MLIHKATPGVLWEVSSFRKDQQCWRRGLRLKDFPDLDPLEWWEVDDRTSLARRCRMYYPDFLPVSDGDRLINIVPAGQFCPQTI